MDGTARGRLRVVLVDRPAPDGQGDPLTSRLLVLSMVSALALIGGLSFWDEERESAAALEDLAQEQVTLATSLASGLKSRLALLAEGGGPPEPAVVALGFDGARVVERPGSLAVFLAPPPYDALIAMDGRRVALPAASAALRERRSWLRLPPALSETLGLPARTSLMGVAWAEAGVGGGRWGVLVGATARRERDREQRARWRLALSVTFAAGLVFAFGGVALAKQRKELMLARELAVAEVRRQRDERLERASKAATMGTMAMGIAHEISTPLAVIAGRAEQVAPRVSDDERASRAVRTILEQTERISQVVRGFLGMARGGPPPMTRVDPKAVVEGALQLVEHRFAGAGVTLAADVSPSVPPIRGDQRLLEQALVNLLLNACDASMSGDRVEVLGRAAAGSVTLVVTDAGMGISPADAERVTDPFFTTKPFGKGTGLGLAVANEIVKSHRGVLSIEPGHPRGTTARMTFPTGEAHHDAAA